MSIRILSKISLLILLLGLLLALIAALANPTAAAPPRPGRLPLADSLRPFWNEETLTPAAAEIARALHIWAGPDHARVIIEAEGALRLPPGVELERRQGELYQVRAQRALLGRLAAMPGVRRVRPPLPHATDAITSEGLFPAGVYPWLNAGWTGSGQSIVIIDLGFGGWRALQNQGELPTFVNFRSFRADGQFETTVHGAAVAEIVHDTAPDAYLSLYAIDTELELAQAVDAAIAQGADVIVHSVSWFNTGAGDGSGPVGDLVRRADAADVVWVNAAGNQARRYYQGDFNPAPSGSGRHLFAPGQDSDPLLPDAGATLCGMLSWDAWPVTDDDYALYLYEGQQMVAYSDDFQTGDQPPTEMLCYASASDAPYAFVVVHNSLSKPPVGLRLFVGGADLQYATPNGSIVQPADAPEALAVGAVFWLHPYVLEPFSSRGPTSDGRIKPDLAAYDGVSTASYGFANGQTYDNGGAGFFGTSAAAPLAGGVAALVRQQHPAWDTATVRAFLMDRAVDMGLTGPDNSFGSGRLSLATATPSPTPTPTPTVTPTPTITPTPSVTPTATPAAPWLAVQPPSLLPAFPVAQVVTLAWGNHQPGDILTLSLTGPVHFPGGGSTLAQTMGAASGSIGASILAENGATPGAIFTLKVASPRTSISRSGVIARVRYLPLVLRR